MIKFHVSLEERWAAAVAAQKRHRDAAAAREAHRDRCEALVPELVEALSGLLATYEEGLSTPVIDKARDVLAKAKDANT